MFGVALTQDEREDFIDFLLQELQHKKGYRLIKPFDLEDLVCSTKSRICVPTGLIRRDLRWGLLDDGWGCNDGTTYRLQTPLYKIG